MRQITLSIVILLMATLAASAKEYRVYALHGKVTRGENNMTVRAKEYLDENEYITIYEGGCLIVTEEKNDAGRRIALKEIGRQRLSVLVERVEESAMEKFWKFGKQLVSSLVKSDTPRNAQQYMSSQGGSYRAEDDDLALLAATSRCLSGLGTSNYPISFVLKESNGSVTTAISDDELYMLSVTNGSNEFLFVNAIMILPDGSRQLMLPIDATGNCCAHLCVPPHTTVDFSQFSGFMPATNLKIILVASTVEVNFSVLYKDLDDSNNTTVKPASIGWDMQYFEPRLL